MLDSQEIINSIDQRLTEARQEIASLESALTAMRTPPAITNGRSSQTRPSVSTRRRTSKRRTAGRRRTAVVPAGKLVNLLGDGQGRSTAELVGETGGDRQQLLTLLRELEATGQVRRSGERRGTRWHAVTDEDRIAARVAELERQRVRKPRAA